MTLERHLVVSDNVYTMKDLVTMSKESDSILLPTIRDSLKIRVEEEAGRKCSYFTFFQNEHNLIKYFNRTFYCIIYLIS